MAVYLGTNKVDMAGGQPVVVQGIDTSGGNVAASDILSGKVAFSKGAKVVGTIPSKAAETITPGTSNKTIAAGQYLSGTQTIAGDADLIASNIKSGANIFGVAGTYSGLVVKSGTTTSGTISTGLSSISYFVIYKTSVTAAGLVQAVYNGSNTYMVYCSSYMTWSKTYATGEASPTISGGTITWSPTTASQGGISGTYNWIAFGA